MKQETKIRMYGLFMAVSSLIYMGCYIADNEFNIKVKPVYVEYFKPGQVLLPDYACSDTLIVNDAVGLNKAMAFIEQGIIESSDGEIDNTFHLYCSVK